MTTEVIVNSVLDADKSIFYDCGGGLTLIKPGVIRNFQDVIERDTTFNVSFTKDKPCFSMRRAFCPYCGSYEVVKNGFTSRELVFMDCGRIEVSVQRYKCKIM